MKLYHGSKNGELTVIKKMQATAGEGVEVPKDELLEAIYLTPDYGFALAMAARPEGLTHIDHGIDGKKGIMDLKNAEEDFDPEKIVYVYELDVPDNHARAIDELQYVVENINELTPTKRITHRAGDVEQYYELINVRKEADKEIRREFKMR